VKRRLLLGALTALVAGLALTAAGCGGGGEKKGGGGGGGVTALPASSCRPIENKSGGDANVLIATDLPRQGPARVTSDQIVAGIRFVFDQRGWKTGDRNIAYQDCDDATAQAQKYDLGKCNQNGRAYVKNDDLLAVIGTYNSGCMQVVNPILNNAPGGPIPMISPANSLTCLTEPAPFCPAGEPGKWYPTGKRNYLRVVAHDSYQGAADATFLQELGIKSVYILDDATPYGVGVGKNFGNAAKSLGIKVLGSSHWDPNASSYEALFRRIKGTSPDAVFIGGVKELNGGQLIKDKVSVLGPNNGDVKLLGPDGMYSQATIDPKEGGAGKDAEGMYASVNGFTIEHLSPKGQKFAADFKKTLGGKPLDPYAIYGAAAAQVLLDAIAKSDGTRGDVLTKLFETNVKDSVLGSFRINENGDPISTKGGKDTAETQSYLFGIVKGGEFKSLKDLTPTPELVDAAKGKS
jgi:branched-chain amino acid transport system substrate-binding protein